MRSLILTFLVLICIDELYAQQLLKPSPVRFSVEIGAMASSSRRTPFWLRANQFGTIPAVGPAGILRLSSSGFFSRDSSSREWFLTYSAEFVGSVGPNKRVLLPEGYISGGKGYLEVMVGRRKEILGLVDTTMSSGSYSWSGNALPMPKIHIGTRGFMPLHFTKDIIAINAFFAHGWFADTDSMKSSYLHQKAVYARVGKPSWKVKLYGGLLHHAQWGGKSSYLDRSIAIGGKLPSTFKDYISILIASGTPTNKNYSFIDTLNQVGNHLGSIDIGADLKFKNSNLLFYYQHAYDDKSGLALKNWPDGLFGVRLLKLEDQANNKFRINHLLFELLTTMNQSGSVVENDNRQYEGRDDYFYHAQYINGWANGGRIIGSPFISLESDVRHGLIDTKSKQRSVISNNRVQAWYIGFLGGFKSGTKLMAKLSFSNNYGRFRAPYTRKIEQKSLYVSLICPVKSIPNSCLQITASMDQGLLFENTYGGFVSFKKSFF